MSRAAKNAWDPVFSRIRVFYDSAYRYPLPITPDALDAVEEELAFRFPLSYRAFAERFGLGGQLYELPELLPLSRPKGAKTSDWSRWLVGATRFYQSYDFTQALTTTPTAFFQRIVVFAMDGGYHTFVFDPLEVTDPQKREYRIYDINRSEEAIAIAESFGEWIEWLDNNYRFDDEEIESEESVPGPFPIIMKPSSVIPDSIPYCPWILGRKKPPSKRNVKRWLKWNNGAILGLALTIRDERQTDSFPILADTLEDAGCTHVELLRSCREGDPEIDGVWVLGALLAEHP